MKYPSASMLKSSAISVMDAIHRLAVAKVLTWGLCIGCRSKLQEPSGASGELGSKEHLGLSTRDSDVERRLGFTALIRPSLCACKHAS